MVVIGRPAPAGRRVVSAGSRARVRCVPTMCPVRPRAVSRSVLMLGSKICRQAGAAMHLSDTLVFGPLHPLLPQPVRVRLVALLVALVGGLGLLTLAGVLLVF